MDVTAKLFDNGRSQAVRIPKALRFRGVDRVAFRKDGDALILTPVRRDWQSFADEAPQADEDFLADRQALFDASRVNL